MVKPSRKTQAPIALLLLPTLLCAILPGCSAPTNNAPASQTAEVTVEQLEQSSGMPVVDVLIDTYMQPGRYNQFTHTLESLPGFDRDFKINVEFLPYDGIERDNVETRIRTEILAGKGPDLFLCGLNPSGWWGGDFESEPFFRFPEQTMNNHILLPLDGYIENAEYLEWDKLLPVVMEAGRNEEEQMILPLAFSVQLTFFDKKTYTPTISMPCAWDEMIQSDDINILCAAQERPSYILGCLSDFEHDVPLISEEDYAAYFEKALALSKATEKVLGNDDSEWGFFKGAMNRTRVGYQTASLRMGAEAPEYWMVPAYNIQGGVTADISVFAAVNRNARHPDLAFKIADYLLSKRIQQNSTFYSELFEGYPVYTGLGNRENPLDDGWYMNDANFQEFQNVLSQINQVKYPGPVDRAADAADLATGEKTAHGQYMLMKMLLAES